MSPPTFEVRVDGVVPDADLLDLNVVAHGTEGPSTLLYGEIRDEAALYGLLERLRGLGIEVIEVRRNPVLEPPPGVDGPPGTGAAETGGTP
jgi:hypothetical protein